MTTPIAPQTPTITWDKALAKIADPTSTPLPVLDGRKMLDSTARDKHLARAQAYMTMAGDHAIAMGMKGVGGPLLSPTGVLRDAVRRPCTAGNVASVLPMTAAAVAGGTFVGLAGGLVEGAQTLGCVLGAAGQVTTAGFVAAGQAAQAATRAAFQAADAAVRSAAAAWVGVRQSLMGQ